MKFILSGLLAVSALASGCNTLSLQTNPLTAKDGPHGNSVVFHVDWWQGLVDPKILEYSPREDAAPAIDPDSGRVIVLTRDGFVRCLSSEGVVQWRYKTGGKFAAGATIREGVAYVPGGDGNLYALDVRTGNLSWKYPAGEELATSPVIANGKVYVVSFGDTLYAVDVKNGEWKWQYRRDPPTGFSVRGVSTPHIQGDVLYLGFADGYVVALQGADGALKWQRPLGVTVGDFVDSDASPILDEKGWLFVASYKEGVFALDSASGDVHWQTARNGVTNLASRPNVVYAIGDDKLQALHAETGRTIWTYSLKEDAARMPAVVGKTLVVPIASSLLFVDATNGLLKAKWDPGQGVSATPSTDGKRIYVLSNLGYLYALTLEG